MGNWLVYGIEPEEPSSSLPTLLFNFPKEVTTQVQIDAIVASLIKDGYRSVTLKEASGGDV